MYRNAIITNTRLGKERGIMTFWIFVEYDCGGQGLGGIALDGYNKEKDCREGHYKSIELISKILDVVGVEKWEDLVGKHVRVEKVNWGCTAKKFGHIMKDKWINLDTFFKEE